MILNRVLSMCLAPTAFPIFVPCLGLLYLFPVVFPFLDSLISLPVFVSCLRCNYFRSVATGVEPQTHLRPSV